MSENFKGVHHVETRPTPAEDLETAVRLLRTVLETSETDPLTGTKNRRGLEKELSRYFNEEGDPVEEFLTRMQSSNTRSRTERSIEQLGKGSVILLDIDYFKKINDGYDHQVGNQVLKAFAQIVETLIRKDDVVCRYGGEEFVLLCPNTDEHGAQILAEKILSAVESTNIEIQNHSEPIKITVSAGVAQIVEPIIVKDGHVEPQPNATLRQTTPEMVNDAIKRADHALYAAKAEGRNTVRLHSDMGTNLPLTDIAA